MSANLGIGCERLDRKIDFRRRILGEGTAVGNHDGEWLSDVTDLAMSNDRLQVAL